VGSIIQRFNIRNGKAAKPYRDNIEEIKGKLSVDLMNSLSAVNMTLPPANYGDELVKDQYCLAEIPDFQGLLPKAHAVGVPVFELTDAEIAETGPVLDQMKGKRTLFKQLFSGLADKISTLLVHA
jgi:chromosome partitioning protein